MPTEPNVSAMTWRKTPFMLCECPVLIGNQSFMSLPWLSHEADKFYDPIAHEEVLNTKEFEKGLIKRRRKANWEWETRRIQCVLTRSLVIGMSTGKDEIYQEGIQRRNTLRRCGPSLWVRSSVHLGQWSVASLLRSSGWEEMRWLLGLCSSRFL